MKMLFRRSIARIPAALSVLCCFGVHAQETGGVPLEAEVSDTATLAPEGAARRLIVPTLHNGGARIVDGDSLNLVASIPSTFNSNYAISPDGKYYYVAETYYSRGTRGTRDDLVTVYNAQTLSVDTEIKLPTGRLIAVPKTPGFSLSTDGKRGYVYNFQPASSVAVLDLVQRRVWKQLVEIPGCGLIYPFGASGFASLCANGALASISIEREGKYRIEHTAPFFNAETDPIFEEAAINRKTDEAFFISFTGLVYQAKLGAVSTVGSPWSLQAAAKLPAATTEPGRVSWRPSGTRLVAIHQTSGRLYVLMNESEHWNHKSTSTEVWMLDTSTRALMQRIALPFPSKGIAVTQEEKPLLFAVSGSGQVASFDALTGEKLKQRGQMGGMDPLPVALGN